jgi:predicted enzyme related to lactoylglutathione lyase
MVVKVNGVDFAVVFVDDYDAAVGFYRDVLGLEHLDYGKIRGGEFETGNLTLQVVEAAAVGQEHKPSGHPIAFQVDDVEAARSELEEKGVEFRAETMDTGVCHMAPFADPAGNALLLHKRYAPR